MCRITLVQVHLDGVKSTFPSHTGWNLKIRNELLHVLVSHAVNKPLQRFFSRVQLHLNQNQAPAASGLDIQVGFRQQLVIIDILCDLLTSRATARRHRHALSSPLPVHSGRVTKRSFTTKNCWDSLPAKNQRDEVQSDKKRLKHSWTLLSSLRQLWRNFLWLVQETF